MNSASLDEDCSYACRVHNQGSFPDNIRKRKKKILLLLQLARYLKCMVGKSFFLKIST